MRLFVGIPLADAVEQELAAVAARLRGGESRTGGRLRWTAPGSWHITLQFLGNATPEQLKCLTARLGEVRAEPVQVQLGELGCFEPAGVFLADVVVTPELATLQQSVVAATSRCGFAVETRPFHPHITLARTKNQGSEGTRERGNKRHFPLAREKGGGSDAALRELMAKVGSQPRFTRFVAHEFLLYESHLGPGSARYEVKTRVELTGKSGQ